MQIRSGVKCALTTVLAVLLVLGTSTARANGRFPRGEHLIEYPSDSNRLILAATYGILTTSDAGKNWYYVCETGFSLFDPPAGTNPGYTGDPIVALTADESLLSDVQTRVTKSSDRACGWASALEKPGLAIDDIALAPSNRSIAVALVHATQMASIQVYETTDNGSTWAPIGTALDSKIAQGYTIDVDPTDPKHIMVSGVSSFTGTGTGVFVSSTDHGTTWTSTSIPNTDIDRPPFIAAVHPTDGKKVFVRTYEWTDQTDANDALLYTKDGGQTWTEVLRPKGPDGLGAKLFGFALSPDGSTAIAGFGDPVEGGGRSVNRDVMGVYKSTGADYSFGTAPTPTYVESVTCLSWTAHGIYVCGSPDGMTSFVAFASDINNVTSAGLKKIMQVNELKGEPLCCNGRAVTACDWSTDCARFNACTDSGTTMQPDAAACMMPEAGRPDSGTGGSAGREAGADQSSGGSAGAGTGGTAGGTGGAVDAGKGGSGGATTGGSGGSGTGGSTTTGGSGGSDGCSCRTAASSRDGSAPPASAYAVLIGLLAAGGWRRSRRRHRTAS